MKRYSPNAFGDMYPDTNGKWVEHSTAVAKLTAEAQALREECASHKQAVIDAMSLSNDMAEIEARKLAALREETQRLRAAMKDAMDIAEWNLPYFVVEPRLAKTRFAAAREILSQAISLSEKPLAQVPQTDANPKNPEN